MSYDTVTRKHTFREIVCPSVTVTAGALTTLSLVNVAAPGSLTDTTMVYSYDQAAGNACFHTKTESGQVIKLYRSMAHVEDPTTGSECASAIATIIDGLKALGFMAPDP